MEEIGTVSLWIGTAATHTSLDNALEVSFSEDGEFLGSPFSRAFGIEYYEDGTREAACLKLPALRLADLLHGASYENTILPQFEQVAGTELEGANAVILLYDIRYDGHLIEWRTDGLLLRFVGSASYQPGGSAR